MSDGCGAFLLENRGYWNVFFKTKIKLTQIFILIVSLGIFMSPIGNSLFGIGDADAQSNTLTRQLLKRINDLESKMSSLKTQISDGGETFQSEPGSQNVGDRVLFADMEVRLGSLDTEIRSLRGDIERILYNQKRMEEYLKNFKEDTEFRFQDLTKGGMVQSQEVEPFKQSRGASRPTSGGFVQTLTPQDAEALLEAEEVNKPPAEINTEPPVSIGEVQSQLLDFEEQADLEVLLSDGLPEEQYQEAFSYMQKGNYLGAEKAFKEFLGKFEKDDLSGNAQYWLGESFYARKDFPRAAEAFLVGLQKYSESSKGPDSLLKLGMSLSSMGQEQEACAAFGEIEARYQNLSRTLSRRLGREMERLGC